MDGYTPTIPLKTRLTNLLNCVPQEYQNRAMAECTHNNPYDTERYLTSYVMGHTWETYPHPVNEMQDIEREIDKKLGNPLFARREAILSTFREEPLTADEAHALINELAEIETRSQEVIDPTGKDWFDFDNVKEIKL